MKVAFLTLGCKVNQYESNAMIQNFIKSGYELVEFDEKADVYVVNTCTVTNMADRKSRQMLRKVKEINPNSILVAVGCYAQVAKDDLEQIPEINLILGTNEKKDIVTYVNKMLANKFKNVPEEELNSTDSSKVEVDRIEEIQDVMHCDEYSEFGDVTFTEKTRAVIKVQDGCDRFCSYCIIPYSRGHIRSRKPDSVISEITKIAEKGIKEVVITGIHLTSYGRDFKEDFVNTLKHRCTDNKLKTDRFTNTTNNIKAEYRLIDLLEEINQIDGIKRIRLRFTRTNFNYR